MSVVEIEDPAERSRLCAHVLGYLPEWFGIREHNPCLLSVKRLRCR